MYTNTGAAEKPGNRLSAEVPGNAPSGKALIVEDVRAAEIELKKRGYECDRITHNELLSSAGTEYTGRLLRGDYVLLWISTPSDWHVRTPTFIGIKKATTHWQRVHHWIQKAVVLGLLLVLYGPPGFLWKMPNIKETLDDSKMTVLKIRLCHFGDKYDATQVKPSGSCMKLATTAKMSTRRWQCNCNVPIQDHVIDWYGRHQPKAEWRKKISDKYIAEVCNALGLSGNGRQTTYSHAFQEDVVPSPPITDNSISRAYPTEARTRAKERLTKMKEDGLKPTKRKKVIEPGTDDCGDDLSGLGVEVQLLSCEIGRAHV